MIQPSAKDAAFGSACVLLKKSKTLAIATGLIATPIA
jgi:hypothetical protein